MLFEIFYFSVIIKYIYDLISGEGLCVDRLMAFPHHTNMTHHKENELYF